MFIKKFHIELNCLFPWFHWLYDSYTHIILVCSCFLFSWVLYMLYRLWVSIVVWRRCFSWNRFMFYSLLEGFHTSFQNYPKTNSYSSLGRVFNYVKINFKLFFEKSLPMMGGWMGDHALHAQIENHFNMCMIWWSLWVIHLILIVFSIGNTIDIYFLYSYLLLYMYASTSNSIGI